MNYWKSEVKNHEMVKALLAIPQDLKGRDGRIREVAKRFGSSRAKAYRLLKNVREGERLNPSHLDLLKGIESLEDMISRLSDLVNQGRLGKESFLIIEKNGERADGRR